MIDVVEEWKGYGKAGLPLCNFILRVSSIINEYTDAEAEPITIVVVKMGFDYDPLSIELSVPLAQLDNFNWLSQDIRCRYNPKYPALKIQRYLADHIRKALTGTPKRQYRIARVGNHKVEDEHIFSTGVDYISSSPVRKGEYDIVQDSISYKMDVDSSLTEAEAVAEMLELISLNPDAGRILTAHTLMYLMRSVYAEAWKAPRCSVFVFGDTGKQKTTYSAYMTQLYNRSDGIKDPARLDASIPAAVTLLYELDDCTVVLDDLFPADSTRMKAQQEETLIEITRIIGDGTAPARLKGGKLRTRQPPKQGAVFTGEYLIGSGSSAARILPVPNFQPNSERLKHFQDNPLIVSTFYRNYLEWYIPKYVEIREYLKEWMNVYLSDVRLGIHDRLQETHYYFNTAYSLMLQYCYEKGLISEYDVERLHRSFMRMLTGLVLAQDELAKPNTSSTPDNVNYLPYIRRLFMEGDLIIADSPEVFSDYVHDGVLHNGCLWLRGKQLKKHFPNANFNDIVSSLKAQDALKSAKGGRTNKIFALEGICFYAIPLEKLQ